MKQTSTKILVYAGRIIALLLLLVYVLAQSTGLFGWGLNLTFYSAIFAEIALLCIIFQFVKVSTKRFLICSGSLSFLFFIYQYLGATLFSMSFVPVSFLHDWIMPIPNQLFMAAGVFGACFLFYLLFLRQPKGKELSKKEDPITLHRSSEVGTFVD